MKRANNEIKNVVGRFRKKFYKFYFVKPPQNANADELAERLISMHNVEEVFVTDADHGFVVMTRFTSVQQPDDVYLYIMRRLGKSFGVLTPAQSYKR